MKAGALRVALALAVAALLSVAAAQATWGVRVDVDLPVDGSALQFLTDPLRYAAAHRDVIDARAFVEFTRFGFEGRYRSATEVFAGGYYVINAWSLFGQTAESTIGIYAGRDLRAGENYLSLRGTILLYGRLP